MKAFMTVSWLSVALVFGVAGLHGCDDEIAREKTVDVDNGEVTTQEKVVRDTDDGIVIEKRTETKDYDDGRVKTEVETERETIPRPQ